MKRKRLTITAAVAVCLLSIAGLSNPGRTAIGGIYSLLRGFGSAAQPAPPAADDVESRARAKHGWDKAPGSWVMRGTITYLDPSGAVARQGQVTVYRQDKEQIRVDIEHQGIIKAQGVDKGDAWQALADKLSGAQERDIRGWLRVFPERMFVERGQGKDYRELGSILDSRSEPPWRGASKPRQAKKLDQVELQDEIKGTGGGNGNQVSKSDTRGITYLIDRDESLIVSAHWLEPDDPTQSAGSATASQEVRVDFGGWRRLEGVLWPMEITRWQGGRVDYHIEMRDVQINRSLPNSLFQKP